MAIRVETSAFNDVRFVLLGKKLGLDKFSARARVENLWEFCTQKNSYYMSKDLIDVVSECENFADALLDKKIDLAEQTKYGIYIRGTEGRIEWLAAKRNNGKKGGRPKKPKINLEETEPITETKPKHNPTTTVTTTVTATATTTAPVTVKEEYSIREGSKNEPSPEFLIRSFIGAYVSAHKKKFDGARPDLTDKKLLGQIKNYLKTQTNVERACALIQVYFQMNDEWFEKRKWDFPTFVNSVQKVALALDTGKDFKPKDGADEWLDRQAAAKGEITL